MKPSTWFTLRIGCGDVAQFDRLVGSELLAANRAKFARVDAVAREITMECARCRIARPAVIADENRTPATAEHERSAQPGRSGTDNDNVVHRRRDRHSSRVTVDHH